MENDHQILSAQQAAELLGIQISYLYKLTSSGKVPYRKPFGKKLLFLRSELEQLILDSKPNIQ
jgi:excisionase family DNA binding protein